MIFKNKEKTDDTQVVDEVLTNDSFDTLSVELNALDLEFKRGEKFEVRFHGRKYHEPQLDFDGDNLSIIEPDVHSQDISRWEKGFFRIEISHDPGKVIVSVPEDATLKSINARTARGDVSVSDVKADELNASLSSGDLEVSASKVDDLSLTTTAGDVSLRNVELVTGNADLTSGDFKILNSQVSDSLEVNTVSGDNTVVDTKFKSYSLHTQSGENRIFGQHAEHAELSNSNSAKLTLSAISGDNTVK